MQHFEATGCVDPKVQPSREDQRKLDDCHELYILGLRYNNPTLQLHELRTKLRRSLQWLYLAQQFVAFLGEMELLVKRLDKLPYKGAQI